MDRTDYHYRIQDLEAQIEAARMRAKHTTICCKPLALAMG